MTLSNTLQLWRFWDTLRFTSAEFTLGEALLRDQNGAGEILTATNGPRLWQGRMTLRASGQDVREALALLNYIRGANKTFLCYPPGHAYPQNDPTGALMAGRTILLSAVAVNNRDVTLSGLPANFALEAEDFVGIQYSGRYGLHSVAFRVVADGSGVATDVELQPPLRPGFTIGQEVTLVKPVMRAVYVPGSYTPPSILPGRKYGGASFAFQQTLRV